MELLKNFSRTIIVFILFTTAIEALINSGSYKKIYRFFSGLVMIVLVISSILKIKGISIDDIFKSEANQEIMNELKSQINSNNAYIKETAEKEYELLIKNNVADIVAAEGYGITEFQTYINDEEGYVEGMEMRIAPIQSLEEGEIAEVSININATEEKDSYENVITSKIKNSIAIIYQIEHENIVIYMED